MMNSDRIKEIQSETAYPNSVSVYQALLQVWNECEQQQNKIDRKAAAMDFVRWINKTYPPSANIAEWLVEEWVEEQYKTSINKS